MSKSERTHVNLNVSIEKTLCDRLDEFCEDNEITRDEGVKKALEDYLGRMERYKQMVRSFDE